MTPPMLSARSGKWTLPTCDWFRADGSHIYYMKYIVHGSITENDSKDESSLEQNFETNAGVLTRFYGPGFASLVHVLN